MKKSSYPAISIITPSFNQADYIERTIKSVLDQDYPNLEYIVMDGGSTDGTVAILKKYGKRIIWKSEKDRGQSDAINKGLRVCTGEVIGYLNSDDILLKGSLKKVAKSFTDRDVYWLTGRCKIVDEGDCEIRSWITGYKNLLLRFFNKSLFLVVNPISQPATFWRREVLKKIGFFNEKEHLCMDYEYWLRIAEKYDLTIISDYLAGFRVHGASKSTKEVYRHFQEELGVIKKFTGNPFVLGLHYLNFLSILAGYYLVQPIVDKVKS